MPKLIRLRRKRVERFSATLVSQQWDWVFAVQFSTQYKAKKTFHLRYTASNSHRSMVWKQKRTIFFLEKESKLETESGSQNSKIKKMKKMAKLIRKLSGVAGGRMTEHVHQWHCETLITYSISYKWWVLYLFAKSVHLRDSNVGVGARIQRLNTVVSVFAMSLTYKLVQCTVYCTP